MLVAAPTLHASCVLVGETGVLIRGPSGAGKSRLAFALILAGRAGMIAPTLLVADDRVLVEAKDGRLIAAPPEALAGLIEVRGAGIRRLAHAPSAALGLVVDLAADDGARLPDAGACMLQMHGVIVPRLPLLAGFDALQPVIALLASEPGPA